MANNVSVQISLLLGLWLSWSIIDVKAAFLNADLKELLFVEWAIGMVELGYLTEEQA